MTARKTEILIVSDDNQELSRLLGKVRDSGDVILQQGSDQFLVKKRVTKISDEARKIMSGSDE